MPSQDTGLQHDSSATAERTSPLLEVQNLRVDFPIRSSLLRRTIGTTSAVNDVSFTVRPGETLGLVGESGSGKTTTAMALLGLVPITSGQVLFRGTEISGLSQRQMRRHRRDLQVVLQNPASALDSRMTVADIIGEPLQIHGIGTARQRRERIAELLDLVGLQSGHAQRYPHEFSGGQQQRIGIARALALEPSLIVLDEPVSALDVSIQAQVINLLADLQAQLGLAYLFIAHDLAVVRHLCHKVAVMYWGSLVEYGECDEVYNNPTHPYTQALLSAVPIDNPSERGTRTRMLSGDVPSSSTPPTGCRFRLRCPRAQEVCAVQEPPLLALEDRGQHAHASACHFPGPA